MTKSIKELDSYTAEQINEIGLCLSDPIYFINTYLFELRPEQEKEVRKYHNNIRSSTRWKRQTGKSSIAAAYMLYYTIFNTNKTAVIVAPTQVMTHHNMEILYSFYDRLPTWLRPKLEVRNKNECRFDHGSSIRARIMNENACRGMGVSLLWIDEPTSKTSEFIRFWDYSGAYLARANGTTKLIVVDSDVVDDTIFNNKYI